VNTKQKGDNDLIAGFPRGLLRIQCKTARITSGGGAVTFNACSIGYKARRGHYTALSEQSTLGHPVAQNLELESFLGTDGLEPSVPSLSSWCFTD